MVDLTLMAVETVEPHVSWNLCICLSALRNWDSLGIKNMDSPVSEEMNSRCCKTKVLFALRCVGSSLNEKHVLSCARTMS
jgi:hypothetical protein